MITAARVEKQAGDPVTVIREQIGVGLLEALRLSRTKQKMWG